MADFEKIIFTIESNASDLNKELDKLAAKYGVIIEKQAQNTKETKQAGVEEKKVAAESERNLNNKQKRLAETKAKQQDYNKTLQQQVKEERAVQGSINATSLELQRLRSEYNNLSKAQRENKNIGGELKKALQDKQAEFKKLNKGLEENKSGFGDLGKSMLAFGTAMLGIEGIKKITGFFKDSISKAIEQEVVLDRLKYALNGDAEATERMYKNSERLAKTTLFSKGEIQQAQIMGLQLGRTEEQTNKMVTAALGLSKVTGQSLDTAMMQLSGTLEGTKGRLGRYSTEIKKMSEEELKAGKAIDVIADKMGRFAFQGLDTAAGKMKQFEKQWAAFQKSIGTFFLPIVTGAFQVFNRFITGLSNLIKPVEKFENIIFKIGEKQRKTTELFNQDIAVLTSGNIPLNRRKELIDNINKQYGEYLPYLLTEKSTIQEITKAQEEANKAMFAKTIIMQYEAEIENAIKQQQVLSNIAFTEVVNLTKKQNDIRRFASTEQLAFEKKQLQTNKEQLKNSVKDTENIIKNIKDKYVEQANLMQLDFNKIYDKWKTKNQPTNEKVSLTDEQIKKEREAALKLFDMLQKFKLLEMELKFGKGNETQQLENEQIKQRADYMKRLGLISQQEYDNEILRYRIAQENLRKTMRDESEKNIAEAEKIAKAEADKKKKFQDEANKAANKAPFDYGQMMLDVLKADEEAAAKEEQLQKEREERIKETVEATKELAITVVNSIGSIVSGTLERVNSQISEQERRVIDIENKLNDANNLRKSANVKQLAEEKKRLNDLYEERKKAVEKQRTLSLIELAINSAVAISKAAAETGIAAPLGIASTLIALAAGFIAAKQQAESAGFYKGGYTGDGEPKEVSTKLGNKGYKYHKGEFVMPANITKENRETFDNILAGKIDLKKELSKAAILDNLVTERRLIDLSGNKVYNINNRGESVRGVEARLDDVTMELKRLKMVVNIDKNGFFAGLSNELSRRNKINKITKL